jgi:hypothetical protein
MRVGTMMSDASLTGREAVLLCLDQLDDVLHRALHTAGEAYGWEPGNTRFRGLYIAEREAERMLARRPGAPPLGAEGADLVDLVQSSREWGLLADKYSLSAFDTAILLVLLAPEIDLRYERIYAYLQDDVSRRRPTVDLLLNLLCSTAEGKLERRMHFSTDAPLVSGRLIHLSNEQGPSYAPLLSQTVRIDEQIVRELLGGSGLDARLRSSCEYVAKTADLGELPLEPGTADRLRTLAVSARVQSITLRLAFTGHRWPLKLRCAAALAAAQDKALLKVELNRLLHTTEETGECLHTLLREAAATNAILFVEVETHDDPRGRAITAALGSTEVAAIIACDTVPASMTSLALLEIPFSAASFNVRVAQWNASLQAAGIELPRVDVRSLAGRFRMHPDQIEAAVFSARADAMWRDETVSVKHLSAAARAQCGREIGAAAQKLARRYEWRDIVLPMTTIEQMRSICGRVVHRHCVLDDWGFEAKLSMGKGVTVLFAGPSGVGKTMAAEVIATELDLDLYRIDLSGVVSKYIGETEKNLERIFDAAEDANAILFFDEADALFGRRSEVKDSHDRYANIEISYLLQRMEMYDGIAILATNLRQNLDDAFIRRLAYTIHFPFPEEQERLRMWQQAWPAAAPVDSGIDKAFLASRFKLTGGNIRNVALAAAFLAAESGEPISMPHVCTAIEREYQKMGKPLRAEHFAPHAVKHIALNEANA